MDHCYKCAQCKCHLKNIPFQIEDADRIMPIDRADELCKAFSPCGEYYTVIDDIVRWHYNFPSLGSPLTPIELKETLLLCKSMGINISWSNHLHITLFANQLITLRLSKTIKTIK